jgi:hypothetical protein
MKYLY